MKTVTISSKNQVVIPSAVRAKLGVQSGDKLIIDRFNETEVVLKKEPSYHELIGIIPAQQVSPTKRIRTIRDEWI